MKRDEEEGKKDKGGESRIRDEKSNLSREWKYEDDKGLFER